MTKTLEDIQANVNKNADNEDYILVVKNLKKYYPIKKGLFSRTSGYVKAIDGVSFKIKRGTDNGPRRGIGLWKDHRGKNHTEAY